MAWKELQCDEKDTRIIETKKGKIKIVFLEKVYLDVKGIKYEAGGVAYPQKRFVTIRKGMSPLIERFVLAHEIYHIDDHYTWGGGLGMEIRATIFPGIKDPLGCIATVWSILSNKKRFLFYVQRFKQGN